MPRYKEIKSADGDKFQLLPTRLQEIYERDGKQIKWRYMTIENVRKALKFKTPAQIPVRAFDIDTGLDGEYTDFYAGWDRNSFEGVRKIFSVGCKSFSGEDLKMLEAWAKKPATRLRVKPRIKRTVARAASRR